MPPERLTPNVAASWHVAPTDPLPIVRSDATDHRRSPQRSPWGLVSCWGKDIKAGFTTINAKTEGVWDQESRWPVSLTAGARPHGRVPSGNRAARPAG